MSPMIIAAIIIVILLGTVVFPLINKSQFKKLPFEQKVRILMKEAKGLTYFKNVSDGNSGNLYYVKNKRKIYIFPWVLRDGCMVCTKADWLEAWDYPADSLPMNEDERAQAMKALSDYNKNQKVKLVFDDETQR